MLPVTLRTARLVLAPPTEADVDAIAAGASDPEVPRWTVVPSPYTRADAEDFVEKTARWWDEGTEFTWAIHLADGFAGMIGLHRAAPGGSAEIGYWMAPAARGRDTWSKLPERSSTSASRPADSPWSASSGVRPWATSPPPARPARSASATRDCCGRR